MRLQKFLRDKKIGSIRKCDEMVQLGLVWVNDVLLKSPTYYLKKGDVVKIANEKWVYDTVKNKPLYYLFYKPVKVLSSHKKIGKRKIVFDYFTEIIAQYQIPIYYAGRLDYWSRGLMIISSDGDFIQQISHPSKNQVKEYQVTTQKKINYQQLKKLSRGFSFKDVTYLPFFYQPIKDNQVLFLLKEGRNRQVRNIVAKLDNEVTDLFRTKIGDYSIGSLKPGEYLSFAPNLKK